MNFQTRTAQFIALIVFAAALYAFNQGGRPDRSDEQLHYDQWLTFVEPRLRELADTLSAKPSAQQSAESRPSGSLSSERSTEQSTSAASSAETAQDDLPSISMSVSYGDAALARTFVINPRREASHIRKLLRVLQLIRESDIISLNSPERPLSNSDAAVSLTVRDNKNQFYTRFMSADISSNSAALLLLRLMEEYASENGAVSNGEEVVFDGKA